MKRTRFSTVILAMLRLAGGSGVQASDRVKVTPLGGQDGEFCVLDRAMVFDDPDGTRIL